MTFISKTWTKGHRPLADLWPKVCWGHMCDSTQGSLCPSPMKMKIHLNMWIQWPFFSQTWSNGYSPLDDLWLHICWGHMCDSTQGSSCPWSILQNLPHTTYIYTTYRMSDHIVSFWTKFRRDKNNKQFKFQNVHRKLKITSILYIYESIGMCCKVIMAYSVVFAIRNWNPHKDFFFN